MTKVLTAALVAVLLACALASPVEHGSQSHYNRMKYPTTHEHKRNPRHVVTARHEMRSHRVDTEDSDEVSSSAEHQHLQVDIVDHSHGHLRHVHSDNDSHHVANQELVKSVHQVEDKHVIDTHHDDLHHDILHRPRRHIEIPMHGDHGYHGMDMHHDMHGPRDMHLVARHSIRHPDNLHLDNLHRDDLLHDNLHHDMLYLRRPHIAMPMHGDYGHHGMDMRNDMHVPHDIHLVTRLPIVHHDNLHDDNLHQDDLLLCNLESHNMNVQHIDDRVHPFPSGDAHNVPRIDEHHDMISHHDMDVRHVDSHLHNGGASHVSDEHVDEDEDIRDHMVHREWEMDRYY